MAQIKRNGDGRWHNDAKIVILIDGTTLKCQRGIQHKAIICFFWLLPMIF